MSAKGGPPKGGNVEFDVPDDVFGDDDDVGSAPAAEEPVAAIEAEEPAPKKERKPPVAAKEEVEEAEEPPDLPPVEPPGDAAYLLAEERIRRAEMEARLYELDQRTQKAPEDKEAAEERELIARKQAARSKAMQALREGDEAGRQEAMWELSDIEREEYRRESSRQMREVRSMREPSGQERRPTLSQQQAVEIETQTFRAAHRITAEEEAQMGRKWGEFIQKNPAWQGVRRWTAMEKALKLVRGSKVSSGGGSALVEGGQHSAPSKNVGGGKASARLPRDSRQFAAQALSMTLEDYDRMIDGGRPSRRAGGR